MFHSPSQDMIRKSLAFHPPPFPFPSYPFPLLPLTFPSFPFSSLPFSSLSFPFLPFQFPPLVTFTPTSPLFFSFINIPLAFHSLSFHSLHSHSLPFPSPPYLPQVTFPSKFSLLFFFRNPRTCWLRDP